MSEASDPIFARIAARYDLINRILSFGQEKKWRRRGVDMLSDGWILDLGSGTGDTEFGDRDVIALDPVIEMLALSPVPCRIVAVGERIPLPDQSVDGVFSGFVFRNLTSVDQTLSEIDRILKPGHALVVVDLSRPRSQILKILHRMATSIVLPVVGLVFARAPGEYWYLHKSLDSLPPPEELFAGRSLQMEEVWRSGIFGFVYGVRLRKPGRVSGETKPGISN